MVLPVTGPFYKVEGLKFPPPNGDYYQTFAERTWSRQTRPYSLRLAFRSKVGASTHTILDGQPTRSPLFDASDYPAYEFRSRELNDAKDKAWSKFISSLGDQASAGETIGEMKQTVGMMASRGHQLYGFARAINRLDFHNAVGYLKIDPKEALGIERRLRDRWSKDRDKANLWLEVHFGWMPLVQDIQNGLTILSGSPRPKVAVGRGTADIREEYHNGDSHRIILGSVHAEYRMDVSISNENTHMLAQLGLVNPIALAWNLTRLSFVFDWFVNVNSWLNSWTDLCGVDVVNPATTEFQLLQGTWQDGDRRYGTFVAASTRRSPTLERPELHVRKLKLPSVTRAATAISLLVQALPHVRR
jgi:hypothetical protein